MRRSYVKVHVFLIVALLLFFFFFFVLTDRRFNKLLHETKYVCDEEGVLEEKRAPVADVRRRSQSFLNQIFLPRHLLSFNISLREDSPHKFLDALDNNPPPPCFYESLFFPLPPPSCSRMRARALKLPRAARCRCIPVGSAMRGIKESSRALRRAP